MARKLVSDADSTHSPSIQAVTQFTHSTHAFLQHLYTAGLIADNPPVGYSSASIDERRMSSFFQFLEWQRAVNPANITQLNSRPKRIVKGWSNVLGMLQEINDLWECYCQITKHWGMEASIPLEETLMSSSSQLTEPKWIGNHYQVPRNWPPLIPAVWALQLDRIIIHLSEQLQIVTAKNREAPRQDSSEPNAKVTQKPKQDASIELLRVFTNNVSDDRIKKASQVLDDDKLSANLKLSTIDSLIRFPSTASAQQLADMLGVSKTAVVNTKWWTEHRKDEKSNEIGRRWSGHKSRAEGNPFSNEEDN